MTRFTGRTTTGLAVETRDSLADRDSITVPSLVRLAARIFTKRFTATQAVIRRARPKTGGVCIPEPMGGEEGRGENFETHVRTERR